MRHKPEARRAARRRRRGPRARRAPHGGRAGSPRGQAKFQRQARCSSGGGGGIGDSLLLSSSALTTILLVQEMTWKTEESGVWGRRGDPPIQGPEPGLIVSGVPTWLGRNLPGAFRGGSPNPRFLPAKRGNLALWSPKKEKGRILLKKKKKPAEIARK